MLKTIIASELHHICNIGTTLSFTSGVLFSLTILYNDHIYNMLIKSIYFRDIISSSHHIIFIYFLCINMFIVADLFLYRVCVCVCALSFFFPTLTPFPHEINYIFIVQIVEVLENDISKK